MALSADSVPPLSGTGAALAGREEEIERVLRSLSEPGLLGSLVVGPPGIGKSALISAVLQRLGPDITAVRLACSELQAERPYGVLRPLLTDADVDVPLNPVTIHAVAGRAIRALAGQSRLIIVVENADFLDDHTASFLNQFARTHQAHLLVALAVVSPFNDILASLWTAGLVTRVDLGGLDDDAAARLLNHMLGVPVSPHAVGMLTALSAGNPRMLKLLASDQKQSGNLVVHDGVAILREAPEATGLKPADLDSRLDQLDPASRDIVDFVALAGAIAYSALRVLGQEEQITELLERGLLRIIPGPGTLVALDQDSTSAVVAATVPPARSRSLWQRFTSVVSLHELPAQSLVPCAHWALSVGEKPAPDVAAAASRRAHTVGDSRLLALLDKLYGSTVPRIRADRLMTCMAFDWHIEAQSLARELRGCGDRQAADVALAQQLLLASMGGPLPADLDQLRRSENSPVVDIALADYDLRARRFAAAAERAHAVYAETGNTLTERARAVALRSEPLVISGEIAAGLNCVSRARSMLEQMGEEPVCIRSEILSRLFRSTYLAGDFRAARELAEVVRTIPKSTGAAKVTTGLAQVRSGQIDKALQELTPTVVELRMDDPYGHCGLAEAAQLFAQRMAGIGTEESASDAGCVTPASEWTVEAEAALFASMALGLRDAATAAEQLLHAGEELEEAGARTLAAQRYVQATRLGCRSAAQHLLTVLDSELGQLAQLCRALGKGIVEDSHTELLTASEHALALGDVVLCKWAADQAIDRAVAARSRATARRARSLSGRAYRMLRLPAGGATGPMKLSDFETALAAAAADGASSAELGARFHLSPRTVEWHLSKIYRRLRVSNRAELRQVRDEIA